MARIKPEFDKRGVNIGPDKKIKLVLVYPMTTEGAQALHPHRAPAWQAD